MSMWLFGYGSLIWKAEFPYKRKVTGFIKGYVRRFYQASPDHRGVPTKPGRVVTLLPSQNQNDIVWGVAYEIAEENCQFVLEHLDLREKFGYDKSNIIFHPGPNEELSEPFKLFVYIGSQENEWFVGEADLQSIAKQIAEAKGDSGTNAEYLFQLANSMRDLAPDFNDTHLFNLEKAVTNILALGNSSVGE